MLDDQLRLLEIYKTLLQKTGNEKYESDVNTAYYWAGFIYEKLGDKEKAGYYTAQMTFDPYKY